LLFFPAPLALLTESLFRFFLCRPQNFFPPGFSGTGAALFCTLPPREAFSRRFFNNRGGTCKE
jgi:hypothetical protein